MKTWRRAGLALLMACTALSWQARAQEPAQDRVITASNPAGIVVALMNMGFNPELTTDGIGDPLIVSRGTGGVFSVFFFGCDETSHDNCQSIRIQVGYDREQPWTPAQAMQLSAQFPFLAVRLDPEGDPFVHWDLHLGAGIPEPVFVRNVRAFEESVTLAADIVYAEEKAAKGL
ncbi:MAG: putative bacterial sensory transduction regulator [Porphyrobacter sp. HL-46]|nr:MAG: putative bacterial sensory transduction regulator [Porphyrobacter sp. HL-46]